MPSSVLLDPGARQRWAGAATLALGGHGLALAAVLLWSHDTAPPPPEPVVLVELPEGASGPAASPSTAQAPVTPETAQQAPQPPRAQALPPEPLTPLRTIDPVPSAPRPVPRTAPVAPVQSTPAAAPQRATSVPAPTAPAPATSSAGSGRSGDGPGTSTKARKAQADYFAMIAAHLQRKKSYPTEAKKARQQGTVTVRFTVARDGSVSAVAIKTSSGHDLLDTATLDLLRRVAPLPRMPSSMERDSVTLALPIDYSLHTD